MNLSETAKIVAILRASWPRTEIPDIDAMVTAYHLGLRSVDYAEAEQAVADCIETCTFLPTVAEIRERIPQRRRLDGKLYNRFHELKDTPNRTPEQQREYVTVCRRLGILYMVNATGPIDVEAAPAKVTPISRGVAS